jgi:hypothetical protein
MRRGGDERMNKLISDEDRELSIRELREAYRAAGEPGYITDRIEKVISILDSLAPEPVKEMPIDMLNAINAAKRLEAHLSRNFPKADSFYMAMDDDEAAMLVESALADARAQERREIIEKAENEKVDYEGTHDEGDHAYNQAIDDVIAAIQ